jgi:FemAB-related protein (PEP-CTERM system-associated)
MSSVDVGSRVRAEGLRVEDAEASLTPEEWNHFVRNDPASTYCHLAEWRWIMGDVLGHECLYRVARDAEGRVAGVLPLVRVRAAPLGSYLLSMPFLNYGGPLGSPAAQRLLVRDATALAGRVGVDLLELRSRHAVPTDLPASDRKITVLLDLPDTPQELWEDGLRAKVRSQIRRPMKEGMEARFGPGELPAFYDVFARHMRDLGTPVLPRAYFERIVELFGSVLELCTVYHGDTPVAVGYGFVWGDEFEITRASALREYSRSAPNMLLYWALMERLIDRGVRTFNFGRCSPGSGTHRFKRQWGGRDVPLPWLQWSRNGTSATPNDESRLLRLASEAWRRTPLFVANRLGPVLARRLP